LRTDGPALHIRPRGFELAELPLRLHAISHRKSAQIHRKIVSKITGTSLPEIAEKLPEKCPAIAHHAAAEERLGVVHV